MTHFELVKHLVGPAHGWLVGSTDRMSTVELWHLHLDEHLNDRKEND